MGEGNRVESVKNKNEKGYNWFKTFKTLRHLTFFM